jgi:VWFA-related protein
MAGLRTEDFVLLEDGVTQKVEHFSQDQIPLAVAVVVDLSQSIEPFLRPLKYATNTAVKALKREDEVALFTFSSDVQRVVGLTKDKRAVSDRMETVSAGGGTNINDAVYEAAEYLAREAPAARRVIVLVSDNVASVPGREGHNGVRDMALGADAAVYSLKVPGYNPAVAKAMRIGGGFVNVTKLTEETGGEVFDVEKVGSLYLAFQSLVERLKTRYTLGYYPTNHAEDGKFRTIEIRLAPGKGKKGSDYSIVAKKGYFATRGTRAER